MKCGTLDNGEFIEGFCKYPDQIEYWDLNFPTRFEKLVRHINGDPSDNRPENRMICHHGCFFSLLFSKYGRPLEIESKFCIEITMPQICHFCGEEITKKFGKESGSLCFHSLDEDHDNWEPDNKVPAHKGCHTTYHCKGVPRPNLVGDNSDIREQWRRASAKYYQKNRGKILTKARESRDH